MRVYRDAIGARLGKDARRWTRFARIATWGGARVAPRCATFKRKPLRDMRYFGDAGFAFGGRWDRSRHETRAYDAAKTRRRPKAIWQRSNRPGPGNFAVGGTPRRFARLHWIALNIRARWKAGVAPSWARRRFVGTTRRTQSRPVWRVHVPLRLNRAERLAEPRRVRAAGGVLSHAVAPVRQGYSGFDEGSREARPSSVKNWGQRADFTASISRHRSKTVRREMDFARETGFGHGVSSGIMTLHPHDMARWFSDLFADEARRPPSGVTGFDNRLAPIFPGRKPGF